jgi:hypothetical protein
MKNWHIVETAGYHEECKVCHGMENWKNNLIPQAGIRRKAGKLVHPHTFWYGDTATASYYSMGMNA